MKSEALFEVNAPGPPLWKGVREGDYLLSISPHVSQTVLRTVADRTDQYPHAIALEIFLANPDVLLDNRFIEYLSSKTDPMPEYMIDILHAASNQTTQRTIIMNEWNRVQTMYMKSMNRALWAMSYLDDYDDSDLSEVAGEMQVLEYEFETIDKLLDAELTSEAENKYDDIEGSYYLPEDLELEVDLFNEWIALRNALISSNRNWTDLTQAELDQLYDLIDHYRTWVGRAAMQVLNEYYDEVFQLPPAFSQEWDPRMSEIFLNVRNGIEVYPIPASSAINIDMHALFPIKDQGLIQFFDALGKEIHRESIKFNQQILSIDVREWGSGVYLYNVSIPVIGVISGKIVIQH